MDSGLVSKQCSNPVYHCLTRGFSAAATKLCGTIETIMLAPNFEVGTLAWPFAKRGRAANWTLWEDFMKRRQFIQAAGAGLAVGAVAKPAIAQSIAGGAVAPDLGLPEIARHHLRRRGNLCEIRERGHRRQISGPALRGRRDRRHVPGRRRGRHRHRRDGAYRLLLLYRQGPDLRARHGRSVRPQLAPDERLAVSGRRQRTPQRVLRQAQHLRPAGRQHGRPDGRLVP